MEKLESIDSLLEVQMNLARSLESEVVILKAKPQEGRPDWEIDEDKELKKDVWQRKGFKDRLPKYSGDLGEQ